MTLSTINAGEASAGVLRWLTLIDLELPAGTLHITDLDREITVDGIVYSPAMVLQGFDGLQDNLDGKPRRISIRLSGLDPVLRARTLSTRIAYGELAVRIAFCDDAWQLQAASAVVCRAMLSNAEATYDEAGGSIEINAESLAITESRNALQLATDQGQLQRFAGDTALSRVAMVPTYQINWGGASGPTLPSNRYQPAGTGRLANNITRLER